ncbi:MAG: hypothetical protein FWC79_06065 [Oscillospiraceae bacterium]|nr:hypothetical protein [Oscillospiraceae bacterium]
MRNEYDETRREALRERIRNAASEGHASFYRNMYSGEVRYLKKQLGLDVTPTDTNVSCPGSLIKAQDLKPNEVRYEVSGNFELAVNIIDGKASLKDA